MEAGAKHGQGDAKKGAAGLGASRQGAAKHAAKQRSESRLLLLHLAGSTPRGLATAWQQGGPLAGAPAASRGAAHGAVGQRGNCAVVLSGAQVQLPHGRRHQHVHELVRVEQVVERRRLARVCRLQPALWHPQHIEEAARERAHLQGERKCV